MKVSPSKIGRMLDNAQESMEMLINKNWGVEVYLGRMEISITGLVGYPEAWIKSKVGASCWYQKGVWGEKVWEILKEK
jgi:hypothetical protein